MNEKEKRIDRINQNIKNYLERPANKPEDKKKGFLRKGFFSKIIG